MLKLRSGGRAFGERTADWKRETVSDKRNGERFGQGENADSEAEEVHWSSGENIKRTS